MLHSLKAPKTGAAQPSGDSATMGGTRKAPKTGAAQPSGDSATMPSLSYPWKEGYDDDDEDDDYDNESMMMMSR